MRQAILKSFNAAANKAVADNIVAAADAFTTADTGVPVQAALAQNLILQGYDAMVINAASPTALNGAIKQACSAGIVAVSFDRRRRVRRGRGSCGQACRSGWRHA